ncbi:MAG TPA: M4 family metallopeptidase [Vicinamibacteria bacterium]|nr:M4 family metallopeptidase [Vicinamibacteria bacterium]
MFRRWLAPLLAFTSAAAAATSLPDALRVAATGDAAALRAWDARVEEMLREGRLSPGRIRADTLLPGHEHVRHLQTHGGVRVFGGDLVRQLVADRTVSVFGTLYDGIDVDPVPSLDADRALDIVERLSGQPLGPGPPELLVLPREDGSFALVYSRAVFAEDGRTVYAVDAHTGALVEARRELQTQSAVGRGTGVLGDTKKMSVRSSGGAYLGDDLLRPPKIHTYDGKGDLGRTLQLLNRVILLRDSDLVSDADNDWTDGRAVDAHAYTGYTYDYFFKRFGRRGLDGQDLELRSFVHPVRLEDYSRYSADVHNIFYANAFYAGNGVMVYGEGLPEGVRLGSQHFQAFAGALDVVAHELTHGVTQYTSGLIYQGEPGALNESFSDMLGTSTEFFFQPAGSGPLRADYLLAEDITSPGAVRSMDNPSLFGHPDHYSRRYTGPLDGGGIHINSGIPNHVYYLAIEGGRNRTSGLAVEGVGGANREQIEKVMYRAFTLMMPARADFSTARAVTLQSARDLYGAGSAAETALAQAWTAVGVR